MSRRPDPLARALRRAAPLPRPHHEVDPTRPGSLADDTGAATAEFAIVTMASVAREPHIFGRARGSPRACSRNVKCLILESKVDAISEFDAPTDRVIQ